MEVIKLIEKKVKSEVSDNITINILRKIQYKINIYKDLPKGKKINVFK